MDFSKMSLTHSSGKKRNSLGSCSISTSIGSSGTVSSASSNTSLTALAGFTEYAKCASNDGVFRNSAIHGTSRETNKSGSSSDGKNHPHSSTHLTRRTCRSNSTAIGNISLSSGGSSDSGKRTGFFSKNPSNHGSNHAESSDSTKRSTATGSSSGKTVRRKRLVRSGHAVDRSAGWDSLVRETILQMAIPINLAAGGNSSPNTQYLQTGVRWVPTMWLVVSCSAGLF